MAEISIIIPIYNAEKYISKCLDALVTQTFKDIEILCIDDGSKDNSLKILNQYAEKDKRIKVFTQANSGPAAARNKGLEAASGKYLMFCDSDDWYEPDMCEQMHKTIIEQNVDVVVTGCHLWDEEENVRPQENLLSYKLNYEGKQKIDNTVIRNTNVLLWNKIFRLDLIKQYSMGFPTGYEHDDDCFYWQYMSVAQTAYFLDKELYNYLRRNDSIMGKVYNKKNKSLYDMLYVMEYFYKFLLKNDLFEEKKSFFKDLYVGNWIYCTDFLDELQYRQAYKIFQNFIQTLPKETAQYLSSYCLPHYTIRIGRFIVLSLIRQKVFDDLTNQNYFNLRLMLFSKINLFSISQKNSLLRIKLLGIRILKLKLK